MEQLREGEILCPECNGTGERKPLRKGGLSACKKCRGHGKLDWVEAVVGKNGCWYIKPGVYFQEVDLSKQIPLVVHGYLGIPKQTMKEIEEFNMKKYSIPSEFLIEEKK